MTILYRIILAIFKSMILALSMLLLFDGAAYRKRSSEWHPAPKPLVAVCGKAVDYCKSKGKSIEQLAIKFAISNQAIATTLFSTANPKMC